MARRAAGGGGCTEERSRGNEDGEKMQMQAVGETRSSDCDSDCSTRMFVPACLRLHLRLRETRLVRAVRAMRGAVSSLHGASGVLFLFFPPVPLPLSSIGKVNFDDASRRAHGKPDDGSGRHTAQK